MEEEMFQTLLEKSVTSSSNYQSNYYIHIYRSYYKF